MNQSYFPKVQFSMDKMSTQGAFGSMMGQVSKTVFEPSVPKTSFKDVMVNTLQQVNQVAQKPDAMLQEAMTTGGVDIHDVMIANAQAELAVNLTAQMVTKAVQAYDRILQIQV